MAELAAQGKVRDLYDVDDDRLLLVATDRISAFDVVLPDAIPNKGRVLTGLSLFWFERTADLVPNHVVGASLGEFPAPFSDNTAVLSAELWDPATEHFNTMAPAAVPRTYHSVALLMPFTVVPVVSAMASPCSVWLLFAKVKPAF